MNRLQDAGAGGTREVVSKMTISHPDAALYAISHAYAPSNLDVYGAVRDFGLRMHVAALPGITFGHIQFGTDVRVTALPPACYVVCFALTGGLQVATTQAVQQVTGARGAVLHPYEAAYFEEWGADTELVSLRIESQYLERGLIQLTERPLREPIRFDPGCDLWTAQAASFRSSLQLLEAELVEPTALATNPRASAMLGELVTTSLLVSQPNNYSRNISRTGQVRTLGIFSDISGADRGGFHVDQYGR